MYNSDSEDIVLLSSEIQLSHLSDRLRKMMKHATQVSSWKEPGKTEALSELERLDRDIERISNTPALKRANGFIQTLSSAIDHVEAQMREKNSQYKYAAETLEFLDKQTAESTNQLPRLNKEQSVDLIWLKDHLDVQKRLLNYFMFMDLTDENSSSVYKFFIYFEEQFKPYSQKTLDELKAKENSSNSPPFIDQPLRVLQLLELVEKTDKLLRKCSLRPPLPDEIEAYVAVMEQLNDKVYKLIDSSTSHLDGHSQRDWLIELASCDQFIDYLDKLNQSVYANRANTQENPLIPTYSSNLQQAIFLQKRRLDANPLEFQNVLSSQYTLRKGQIEFLSYLHEHPQMTNLHSQLPDLKKLKEEQESLGKLWNLGQSIVPLLNYSKEDHEQVEALLLQQLNDISTHPARDYVKGPIYDEFTQCGLISAEVEEMYAVNPILKELQTIGNKMALNQAFHRENSIEDILRETELLNALKEKAKLSETEFTEFKLKQSQRIVFATQDAQSGKIETEYSSAMPENWKELKEVRRLFALQHAQNQSASAPSTSARERKYLDFSDIVNQGFIEDRHHLNSPFLATKPNEIAEHVENQSPVGPLGGERNTRPSSFGGYKEKSNLAIQRWQEGYGIQSLDDDFMMPNLPDDISGKLGRHMDSPFQYRLVTENEVNIPAISIAAVDRENTKALYFKEPNSPYFIVVPIERYFESGYTISNLNKLAREMENRDREVPHVLPSFQNILLLSINSIRAQNEQQIEAAIVKRAPQAILDCLPKNNNGDVLCEKINSQKVRIDSDHITNIDTSNVTENSIYVRLPEMSHATRIPLERFFDSGFTVDHLKSLQEELAKKKEGKVYKRKTFSLSSEDDIKKQNQLRSRGARRQSTI